MIVQVEINQSKIYYNILQKIGIFMLARVLIFLTLTLAINSQPSLESQPPPTPQQPTKLSLLQNQIQLKIEPLISQYVISVMFNNNEQLLGITNDQNSPSWIFIDEGANEHKTCFENMPGLQTLLDAIQNVQQSAPNAKRICVPVQDLKCQGSCKQISQLSRSQKSSLTQIQGTHIYELQLSSLSNKFTHKFISASELSIGEDMLGDADENALEFNLYRMRNYYFTIVGEVSVRDFGYAVVSHHSEREYQNYYYISVRDSFADFDPSTLIKLQPSKKVATKVSLPSKPIVQLPLSFSLNFNSSQHSLGLPPSIYTPIYTHILEQIFDNQCTTEPGQQNILICRVQKIKELEETVLSVCAAAGACVEVGLDDLVVMWEEDGEEDAGALGQTGGEERYQYFMTLRNETNIDTIIIYPEFLALYKVLLQHGQIYALSKHKTVQPDHSSQKASPTQPEHPHPLHTDIPTTSPTNATTNASTTTPTTSPSISSDSRFGSAWPIISIVVGLLALGVMGYGCYNFMNGDEEVVFEMAERDEEGSGRRRKIFDDSVEMIENPDMVRDTRKEGSAI